MLVVTVGRKDSIVFCKETSLQALLVLKHMCKCEQIRSWNDRLFCRKDALNKTLWLQINFQLKSCQRGRFISFILSSTTVLLFVLLLLLLQKLLPGDGGVIEKLFSRTLLCSTMQKLTGYWILTQWGFYVCALAQRQPASHHVPRPRQYAFLQCLAVFQWTHTHTY